MAQAGVHGLSNSGSMGNICKALHNHLVQAEGFGMADCSNVYNKSVQLLMKTTCDPLSDSYVLGKEVVLDDSQSVTHLVPELWHLLQ